MTRGERVCAFIERYCRVPEGAHVGKPIVLAPFQRRFILEVYDNPHGTRRAILSIARKNGKTALIAAIVLAHVAGPEKRTNSQVVSGARSRDQAALVFNLAAKMVQLSPELSKIVRIVPSGKRLIGLVSNVEYRALAADGTTAHGLSPVVAILDELGQVRGERDAFVDAITTSQGAHDDPLLFAISTQAPTDADMLSKWIDHDLTHEARSHVCHLYAAPEDCDLDDRVAWKVANPGMGIFRSLRDVEEQAETALGMPAAEQTFRNLILNQRVNMFSPFVGRNLWTANGGEPNPAAFEGSLVYGGLDLSSTTDLTALVLAADDGGAIHVQSHFWTPEDTLADRAKKDRVPYDLWRDQGHLRTTPGKALDYRRMAADIVEIVAGMNLVELRVDPYRLTLLKPHIEDLGVELPIVEMRQGFISMGPAVDALEVALLQERIRHGMHPVLTWNAAGAVVVTDAAGNRKLDKSKSTGRIDGMVSLAMAVCAQAQATQDEKSFWEG